MNKSREYSKSLVPWNVHAANRVHIGHVRLLLAMLFIRHLGMHIHKHHAIA
jgi:hypothetical protein